MHYGAYYRIVRELATGQITNDTEVIKLFVRFGLDAEDLKEMMETITGGGVLCQAGVPAPSSCRPRQAPGLERPGPARSSPSFLRRYFQGSMNAWTARRFCPNSDGTRPAASMVSLPHPGAVGS